VVALCSVLRKLPQPTIRTTAQGRLGVDNFDDGCARKQGVWWVVVCLVVVVDIADNSPPVLPERISNNPKQLVRVANPNMHVSLKPSLKLPSQDQ